MLYGRIYTGTCFVQFTFIADLFLVIDDIDLASYADNNTIYYNNDCADEVMVFNTARIS